MIAEHVRARMREALRPTDLDAIVAISPENVFYLSRALILTQRYIPDRLAIVVWPREGEPAMIVCSIEETLTRQDATIAGIRTYVEFRESPVQFLAGLLAEQGLQGGRLGFEPSVWTLHAYQELTRLVPAARFVPANHVLDLARMIKNDWEIAHLSHAALATDKGIARAFGTGRRGWSEKDLGDVIQATMLEEGADYSPFLVLAAGENSKRIHHFPTRAPMPDGAVVHFDGGGFWQGYYSDLARSAVVAPPTAQQRDIYARLWAVQQEAIDAVRPGIRACDLYQTCAALYPKHGLTFGMPLVGHSLGIVLHEYPVINPVCEEPLQPGMMLCIEPAVLGDDGNQYHIEDLVLVTDDGPRIVSRAADWSSLPVIGG